jgi:hypothetical protein
MQIQGRLIFGAVIAAVIFPACSGTGTKEDVVKNDSVLVDSSALTNHPIDPRLHRLFDSTMVAPYDADSEFISTLHFDASRSLTAVDVKYLSFGYVEMPAISNGRYYVDEFISSVVLPGDTGLKTDASAIHKILINDSTCYLLWLIDHCSQEGCAGNEGMHVYASTLVGNNVTSCTAIGVYSYSAEPGYSSGTTAVFNIGGDGRVRVEISYRTTEADPETGVEIIAMDPPVLYELVMANRQWAIVEVVQDEGEFR